MMARRRPRESGDPVRRSLSHTPKPSCLLDARLRGHDREGLACSPLGDCAQTFAANRATGHIALAVAAAGGVTRRARVHEDGSLRVRFPNAAGDALEAVIVNTGGGMTGGDRFSIGIEVGEGARLIAGSAAAEKIYRSTGPDAVDGCRAVGGGGRAARLAAAGDDSVRPRAAVAPHRRRSRAGRVAADGGSRACSAAPPWARRCKRAHWSDRWRVRRGGRLVFAESARLDGAIAGKLARAGRRQWRHRARHRLDRARRRRHARGRARARHSKARPASRPGTASRWRGWSRATA